MLYMQQRNPARRARIAKYLRCEAMSPYDRSLIGDARWLLDRAMPF